MPSPAELAAAYVEAIGAPANDVAWYRALAGHQFGISPEAEPDAQQLRRQRTITGANATGCLPTAFRTGLRCSCDEAPSPLGDLGACAGCWGGHGAGPRHLSRIHI